MASDLAVPDTTIDNQQQLLKNLARPATRSLGAYNAGLSAEAVQQKYGAARIAKLASNENPLGASPQVVAALEADARFSAIYSDASSAALCDALALDSGVAASNIIIGNGSEDILHMLALAFLSPGDRVVTLIPSFGLHEIFPRMMGADVTMVGVNAYQQFDTQAWEAALSTPAKMVIFSNPSNPVGCMLNREGFARIIEAAPQDCVLVIDEAYFEYCETDADYPDSLRVLAEQSRPWIVLRTFSKAYGLAGLRVGYGLACHAELVSLLDRVRTPFNINRSAQVAAVAALQDKQHVRDSIAQVTSEREKVRAELSALGFHVAPSYANFLFFDCGQPASGLAEQLLTYGVIIKPWREPGYEQWIRVSIGNEQDNRQFIDSLKRILAEDAA
ncbi:histidinol-phosphate transaminase [Rahnella woolbedingensis]|uniref:Histidinol-phosphate aminotransferase n=1 Tax=Rahnella woolbedingensis TaxID=1510574 RepID=A0A419N8Y7_9GAMM|nr:histidinol-phosphate transaminase [Rahnella woolbedingensis]RJT44018.1 histidinol-phosphate transaminase [Rahnella woolbedingensis]